MAETASELRPFLNEQGQLISLPAKNKKKLLAIWYLAAPPRALQPPSAGSHERRKDLLEGRDRTDAAGISGEELLRRRKWTLNL